VDKKPLLDISRKLDKRLPIITKIRFRKV